MAFPVPDWPLTLTTLQSTSKLSDNPETREDLITYPSFIGGIGTLPALFSFDSTDVTLIPPVGLQTFFTLSTKSAVSFPSKNSSMLLFLIKNSAWYCGIPEWYIEK